MSSSSAMFFVALGGPLASYSIVSATRSTGVKELWEADSGCRSRIWGGAWALQGSLEGAGQQAVRGQVLTPSGSAAHIGAGAAHSSGTSP